MKKFLTLFLLAMVATVCAVHAQTTGIPQFILNQYSDLGIVSAISDNGKWAIIKGATGQQQKNGVARILNIETGEEKVVKALGESDADAIGKYVVNDITDDGNIVVGGVGSTTDDGTFMGKPAYYNVSEQKWHEVKLPLNVVAASITSVTPDGKWAVGFGEDNVMNIYDSNSRGIMWNMTTGAVRNLIGKPDMPSDYSVIQERFMHVSADGRIISIYGNQSVNPTAFVFDTTSKTAIRFGREGNNAPAGFAMMETAVVLSPNGKYAAATVRNNKDEIFISVLDIETKTYTNYDATEQHEYLAGHIDNDGNVYASTPGGTPVREWSVLSKGVFYPFSLIMQQRYNRDFSKTTNYDNTGTLWTGSADGSVLGSMVSPQGEGYIVKMPEPVSDACQGIDLLQAFTATPQVGAAFGWINEVKIQFSQRIKVLGGSASATLKDGSGATVRSSIGFKVSETDANTLVVTFRETQLNNGVNYTVEIPAGTLCVASNESLINKTISVSYTGRESKPVYVVKTFPEDGAELTFIDNTNLFVVFDFDASVKLTDKASGRLVEITEDGEKTVASLAAAVKDNQVALLPTTVQYLFLGAKYKAILDAGSVTDLSGSSKSANEECVVNYTGAYERKVSSESSVIFKEDFNTFSNAVANMMRYEGDHNSPTAEMQALGFDADNEPWNFTIHDTETSKDYCATSTSMYSPAGQSDDWMSTPQLYIPDEFCTLTFKAQKYRDMKDDKLNVVIWECDERINYLNSNVIDRMKAEGEIKTFTLSIGETEEGLEGEYENFSIDLPKYSEKNIYIAFWNNNNNQSLIFLDDVMVTRNMKYLLSMTSPESVVNAKDIKIEGMVLINSDTDTYSDVKLTLKDSEGKEIDTFSLTGQSLKKNDFFQFQFNNPLPLTVSEITNYTISVKLDNYESFVSGIVKNLSFEPEKRVVLEETTGTTCPNCPKGILAIERLEAKYGERFIPVSLHTYDRDPYTSTALETYSLALGLVEAPSAMIQRNGIASLPMDADSNGAFIFSNGYSLWQDFVDYEMSVPTYLEVSIPSASRNTETDMLNITLRVKSALNLKNQFLYVFPVVLEDGFINSQLNTYYGVADPALGEWGKGGKYGVAEAHNITHNDVARDYWGDVYGSNVGLPQKYVAGENYDATLQLSYPQSILDESKSKIVFMVVDATTRAVVNAIRLPMSKINTGIENVMNDSNDVNIRVNNSTVTATAEGNVSLELYTVSGSLLAKAAGNGATSVTANGYKGAVVVKVKTAEKTVTEKFIF